SVLASVTSATTTTLNVIVPATAVSGNVYVQVGPSKSNNFNFKVINLAPVVNAGTNQTISLPVSANLSGTASDDGLPNNSLTTTCSKFSGAGSVTFGNVNALSTTATFSTSGTYVLRLTASDSALSSTSDVTITVNPAATNTAPVVNAGSNQAITLPAGANLSGTATDDGLPSGTLQTTWSTFSGPGTVSFPTASALTTTATFSTSGTYVLRLTATDTSSEERCVGKISVNP